MFSIAALELLLLQLKILPVLCMVWSSLPKMLNVKLDCVGIDCESGLKGVFTSSQVMANAQQHSCEGINFIKLLFKQTLLNALNWITSNYSNKYQLNL